MRNRDAYEAARQTWVRRTSYRRLITLKIRGVSPGVQALRWKYFEFGGFGRIRPIPSILVSMCRNPQGKTKSSSIVSRHRRSAHGKVARPGAKCGQVTCQNKHKGFAADEMSTGKVNMSEARCLVLREEVPARLVESAFERRSKSRMPVQRRIVGQNTLRKRPGLGDEVAVLRHPQQPKG